MQLQDVLNYCSSHGHVNYKEAIRFSGSKESIAVYASLDRLVILTEHSNGDVVNQIFKDTELKRSIDSALSRRLAMNIHARTHTHNVSECPWCGRKPSTTSIRGKDDNGNRITEGYIIACSIKSCKAKPALDNQCSTVKEAITAWNKYVAILMPVLDRLKPKANRVLVDGKPLKCLICGNDITAKKTGPNSWNLECKECRTIHVPYGETREEAISKWEECISKWKAMGPEKQQASREYRLAAYNKRKAEKEAEKEAASKATAKAMAESVYS